jgi:hypothetical protein
MKNNILHALATFVASNYDQLKKDYNELSKETKAKMPITIFIIGTFDTLLSNQQEENAKSDTITEVSDAQSQLEA